MKNNSENNLLKKKWKIVLTNQNTSAMIGSYKTTQQYIQFIAYMLHEKNVWTMGGIVQWEVHLNSINMRVVMLNSSCKKVQCLNENEMYSYLNVSKKYELTLENKR